MISTTRSTYPAILKEIRRLILELLPFFHQIFENLMRFVMYLINYQRYRLSLNYTNVHHDQTYLPCNFKVNPTTHLGVIALFSSNFQNFYTFCLYLKNYQRQGLSLNCKNVQLVKIYQPGCFEVNMITDLGVIALFSSNFRNFNMFCHVSHKLLEIEVKFELQKCSAC